MLLLSAVHIGVQVSVQIYVFLSLRYIFRSGINGPYGGTMLNLYRIARLFFIVVKHTCL